MIRFRPGSVTTSETMLQEENGCTLILRHGKINALK